MSLPTDPDFYFGLAIVLLALVGPVLRYRRREWALERKFARNGGELPADYVKEYNLQTGEAPRAPTLLDLGLALLGGSQLLRWLYEQEYGDTVLYGAGGALAMYVVYVLWRWVNDPEELRQNPFGTASLGEKPEMDVPREAILGFTLAAAVLAGFVAFLVWA